MRVLLTLVTANTICSMCILHHYVFTVVSGLTILFVIFTYLPHSMYLSLYIYIYPSMSLSVMLCVFFTALCKFFVISILSLFAEHTQINLLSSSHRLLLFTKYRNAQLNSAQQAYVISINLQESTNIKFKASLIHIAESITHHKRT